MVTVRHEDANLSERNAINNLHIRYLYEREMNRGLKNNRHNYHKRKDLVSHCLKDTIKAAFLRWRHIYLYGAEERDR